MQGSNLVGTADTLSEARKKASLRIFRTGKGAGFYYDPKYYPKKVGIWKKVEEVRLNAQSNRNSN